MQKYTRPLEKLTPNTVSLERIIIKAIYDTVFIHRKICPGVLFLQFGSMPDSTPPPLCPVVHISPDPPGHGKGQSNPSGAVAAPAQPLRSHRRSDAAGGKATQREETAPAWGAPLFYQNPSCAGPLRAGESGTTAQPKALRSRTLHRTPGAAPRTSSENLTKPRTREQFPLPGFPGEDGDCSWACPWASERRGQPTRFCHRPPLPQSPLVSWVVLIVSREHLWTSDERPSWGDVGAGGNTHSMVPKHTRVGP